MRAVKIGRVKILGVDPGTSVLGLSVIEVVDDKVDVLETGVINLRKYKDHVTKLKEIYLQLQEVIEHYLPAHLAIEAPFYGKNPQSMLKLGRAQGVAMTAAITMGLKITEYSPKRIKQAITGNGNASKEQVAAMLEQLTKTKLDQKFLDATDALAAAMTHYYQLRSPIGGTKSYNGWEAYIKENPGKIS